MRVRRIGRGCGRLCRKSAICAEPRSAEGLAPTRSRDTETTLRDRTFRPSQRMAVLLSPFAREHEERWPCGLGHTLRVGVPSFSGGHTRIYPDERMECKGASAERRNLSASAYDFLDHNRR